MLYHPESPESNGKSNRQPLA